MGFLAFILIFVAGGTFYLFLNQIFSIISEASLYEKHKNHNLETHYIVIPSKNEKNLVIDFLNFFKKKFLLKFQHNPYNKGFFVNFYELIGPSLLHILFPLPKIFKEGNIKILRK